MIIFPITDMLDDQACLDWLSAHLHPDGFVCSQCGSQERRSFRRHGWARSVLAVLADPNLDPTRWHEAAVFAALRRALMLLIKNAVVRGGSTRSTYCVHLTVTTNPIAEPDSAAVVRMPNTRART